MVSFGKMTLAIYALCMAVGGIMGMSKSIISFVAGVGCAILLGVCFYAANTKPKSAFMAGAVIALLMAGQMFMRFQKSGHFMPAGLISLISAVAMLALAGAWAKTQA
jgi:uncharacterized membrane protein (UPF0136 family)